MQKMEIENQGIETNPTNENLEVSESLDENVNLEANQDNSGSKFENGKQSMKTQTEQEYDPEWWKKDERHKKGLLKDEQAVIKAYYHLEKELNSKYKPAYSTYENINKTFEKLGIKPDELENHWQEYTELKDPNNPRNQDAQLLEDYLSNPDDAQRIGNFFRELQVQRLQRQYPNMNQQQIENQIKIETELKELKAAEQKRKDEAIYSQTLNTIKQSTDEIAKFASERGFEFNEEIKADILKHCLETNQPPQNLFAIFIQRHGNKLLETIENKMRDKYTSNLKKNDNTKIPTAKKIETKHPNSSEANKEKLRGWIKSSLGM